MNKSSFDKLFEVKALHFVWVFLWIIFVLLLSASFFSVDSWERAVMVTLGKVSESSYSNGVYMKWPLISKVVKYDLRNEKIELDTAAASKDLQDVSTTMAVNFTLVAKDISKIYSTLGTKSQIKENIIMPSINEVVKSVFSNFTAEDLVKKRADVSKDIFKKLESKTSAYGITLIDVNIVNFKFSDSFNNAIESKVRAEQEALTEKNKLEKTKYMAQQKIEEAKGEAEKIKINAEAIQKQGWKEYIQLQFIQKWDGKLPTVMWGWNNSMLLDMSKLM